MLSVDAHQREILALKKVIANERIANKYNIISIYNVNYL